MQLVDMLSVLLVAVLIVEALIFLIVRYFRQEFQWLITRNDEQPEFDRALVEKYINGSFDPLLGWVRKPNTRGIDKGRYGEVGYSINELGSRNLECLGEKESQVVIASVGDSYTFCRQVEDSETWQALLSTKTQSHVLNFGVGNYGLDQALLRYNQLKLPATTKIVIMGVVPETICRVHSYWKHYFEFGNILAFKPRYRLLGDELVLSENVMKTDKDFYNLADKLPDIQAPDGFYRKKFRSQQFRFPYLYSLLRNPMRNFLLLFYLLRRKLIRLLKLSNVTVENAPFSVIMKYNILYSHSMYRQPDQCKLLKAIILKFKQDAESRGHKPVLLLMPQLLDLELIEEQCIPYEHFYREMTSHLDVIDITRSIMARTFAEFYAEDSYGGHFSAKGNDFLSNEIMTYLQESCPDLMPDKRKRAMESQP